MIEIFIILVVTVADALRDRWMFTLGSGDTFPCWTWKQWRWHFVKWIAFYLPLVYIVITAGFGWSIAPFGIVCLIAWQVIYKWRSCK